jgi:hypothetical protein
LRCRTPRAGPVGAHNFYGAQASLAFCDSLLMARAAIEHSGTATPAGVVEGMEGLTRPSALPMSTRLDAAHHDGGASYRVIRYDEGCGCFVYVSEERPIG